MSDRNGAPLRRLEVGLLGLGLLVAALLVTDLWPALRGPENWQWGRRLAGSSLLAAVVLVAVGQGLVAFRIRRLWGGGSNRVRFPWLAAAVVLVFLQMVLLTAAEPGGLSNVARRVIDPSFTSYHTIARDVDDVGEFLREYPEIQGGFPVHGPSQPPGRVLFFRAVNRWAEESGAMAPLLSLGERLGGVPAGLPGTTDGQRAGAVAAGFLLMILGALALLPLVLLAGGRCEPGSVAGTTFLMGVVPSYLLFTPQTDHLVLLLTCGAAALIFEAMRYSAQRRSFLLGGLGGLTAGAALFVSFTTLAALGAWGLAAIGMAAFGARRGDPFPPWPRIVALVITVLAGTLVVPVIVAAAGMDWVAVFRACVENAERVQRDRHGRDHATWILWNLGDFVLFLGVPLALAWLVRARAEIVAWRDRGRTADGRPLEIPFALTLAAALLVLDVSGKILGETGRIWMFLMPFAALAAGTARGLRPLRETFVLGAAQVLVLLAMRATLNVPG